MLKHWNQLPDELSATTKLRKLWNKSHYMWLLIFLIILTTFSFQVQNASLLTTPNVQTVPKYPKNIILMIGDGMGLGQISAAMIDHGNYLHLEKFPVIGFQKTHAANVLVTDSAAGATAMSCGVKANKFAIGVDLDTLPCLTILEEAEANGLATGLIATSTIVHATPAAFIAHQPMRSFHEQIAADFLKTEIDLFIGGGKKYFDRRDSDGRNLISELRQKGYYVGDYFKKKLSFSDSKPDQNFAYFTADNIPLSAFQGRDYLSFAAREAAKFLKKKNEKGFFLMIEGSQIDWGGHANEPKQILTEMADFNKAIGEILRFAVEDGETLVIVTADHETGGVAVNPGSKIKKPKLAFTSNDHTATMVPVFAFGPQAILFQGIYDNTQIHAKMQEAFQFGSQK